MNNPKLRSVCPGCSRIGYLLITLQAYDVHHRPLPEQTSTRAHPRPSTPPRATTPTPTPTPRPTQNSTSSRASRFTLSLTDCPRSGTVVVLERHDDAHKRRMKERSEWASKSEERRLDKLKAYIASEEIQNLGQKQAVLVEKMIQDLFALTPEWEMRRMKARAVSIYASFASLLSTHNPSPSR